MGMEANTRPIEVIVTEIQCGIVNGRNLAELATSIQRVCKPANLSVLILDKDGLAKDDGLTRANALSVLVAFLHGLFPEWRLVAHPVRLFTVVSRVLMFAGDKEEGN